MTLPTNVGSGRIVGRFVVGIIDSPNDLDDEPELIPAQGTITFTPNIKYIPNSTTEIPMTIMQAPITGVLDSEGYLCTPDNSNTVGGLTRGVKLFATDVGQVTGWTYTVKYSFTPVGTIVPSIPEHTLTVPNQSTQDLVSIAPTPFSPVMGIPQIEATALRTEKAATKAITTAESAMTIAQTAQSVSEQSRTASEQSRIASEKAANLVGAPADEVVATLLGTTETSTYLATDKATRSRLAPSRNTAPIAVPSRVISTFQTGHGWTVIEGGGTLTSDTTDTARGSMSAKLVTDGTGTSTTIGINGLAPMDLKRNYVRVTLKVDDWAQTNQLGVRVRAGLNVATRYRERSLSPAAENLDFGGSGHPKLVGGNDQWQTSTVTFSITNGSVLGSSFDFASCTALGISIQDTGRPVTVHISEVSLIPKPDAYPNGVVSITFDDGRTSQWTNGFPILNSRGLPATMFVIRDRTDAGTHVTHENLKAMQDAGWEIAAHTNTLSNHDMPRGFLSLSPQQLDDDLAKQKQWMIEHGYNGSEVSAYPQGWYSQETVGIAKRYLTSVRTTITDDGLETLPPADPYRVRCVHIADSTTLAAVKTQIDRAYEYGDWLILYTHDVLDGIPGASTTPAMLTQISDYLVTKGIPVRTYGEVLRSLTSVPPAVKFVPPEPPHILGPKPEEYGLLGWNFDPLMASDDVQSAPAGSLLGARVYAKPGTLLAGVNLAFKAAVPVAATGCYVGVYSATGTRLTMVTGDQASNFNAAGERRFGMPTFTMPTEGYVYVVILVASSTTLPAWCGRAGDRATSFGFPGTGRSARAFTVGTGLTTLPATIDMSAITRANSVPWIGLSV